MVYYLRMMTKKKSARILAILITLLFAAVIILAAAGLSEGGKAFPTEINVAETPIRYDAALTERFYRAFRLFFLTENVANPMFEWMFDTAFHAFSTARIPSEKVVWFLEKLELTDADNNPAYAFMQEKIEAYDKLMADYEAGLIEKPPTYHDVFTAGEMQSGVAGAFTFMLESPLTNDELGRLFYRSAIIAAGDSDYGELLKTIGERDISMLTVGTFMVYRAATGFSSASSVSAARAVGQSVVALGSSYLSLIKKVGLADVNRLFGLDYRIAENETNGLVTGAMIPYYNEQLDEIEGLAGGVLLLAGNVFSKLSETFFEEMFLSNESQTAGKGREAQAHKTVAATELAYAVRTGLDAAKANSEKVYETDSAAIALLSKGYAANFRMTDILDGNLIAVQDTARYALYQGEAQAKLTGALQAVDVLKDGAKVKNYYDILLETEQSDPNGYRALCDAAAMLFDFELTDTDGATNLLTGLLFNIFVRFLIAK